MGQGPEERRWSGRLLAEAKLSLSIQPAWQRGDRQVERDAIAFWHRLGLLPIDVAPADRAKELAAAAYDEAGKLVGVSTIFLAPYEPLRRRFAWYRCAVDPDHRRALTSTSLTVFTRDLIERWSAEHREEKVLGLGAVIDSRALAARQKDPLWANTRLNLVGHTGDGRQVRIAWFAHAEVEPGTSRPPNLGAA